MPFEHLTIIAVVILATAVTIIGWKCLDVLQRTTSFSKDREHTRLLQYMEKVAEKTAVPLEQRLQQHQIHAEERVAEVRANADMEKEVAKINGPLIQPQEEMNPFESFHQ